MTRFFVVATMRRGAVDPPEMLSDADAARAFSQLRADESREQRVVFERALWRNGRKAVAPIYYASGETTGRVRKLLDLAKKVRVA
jgi:hypothetical protein